MVKLNILQYKDTINFQNYQNLKYPHHQIPLFKNNLTISAKSFCHIDIWNERKFLDSVFFTVTVNKLGNTSIS